MPWRTPIFGARQGNHQVTRQPETLNPSPGTEKLPPNRFVRPFARPLHLNFLNHMFQFTYQGSSTRTVNFHEVAITVESPWPTPTISTVNLQRQLYHPGRGTTRAGYAQGTPTRSHISPSILVYRETTWLVRGLCPDVGGSVI